jgi:GntR family transcriptional repressor for pyruvate dehydrogenase complex
LLEQHRAIHGALMARDSDGARAAVEAHLTYVEESLSDQKRMEHNERIAKLRLEHEATR